MVFSRTLFTYERDSCRRDDDIPNFQLKLKAASRDVLFSIICTWKVHPGHQSVKVGVKVDAGRSLRPKSASPTSQIYQVSRAPLLILDRAHTTPDRACSYKVAQRRLFHESHPSRPSPVEAASSVHCSLGWPAPRRELSLVSKSLGRDLCVDRAPRPIFLEMRPSYYRVRRPFCRPSMSTPSSPSLR